MKINNDEGLMQKIETLVRKITRELSAQDFKRQVIYKNLLVMTNDQTLFQALGVCNPNYTFQNCQEG